MLTESPLGQATVYVDSYAPELLFPIPRSLAREKLGLNKLPFDGYDTWCGYELGWLNPKGKPEVAMADFTFPCKSANIIESKSFKLYLNSFHQTHFASLEEVQRTIQKDLSAAANAAVEVNIYPLAAHSGLQTSLPGICLDDLDIETSYYTVDKKLLCHSSSDIVEETLYTDLLKSNCLVTGQPDWGSLCIHYIGQKIDHAALLRYFISFRKHSGFAEHCTEQIFCDLMSECALTSLSVYCRYTRRGGLDINPFRSNFEKAMPNMRLVRQ